MERTLTVKGKFMTIKRWKQGLMVMALGMGLYGTAHATGVNPDSIVVSVTPGGLIYAVTITSPMVSGYAFGTVALGGTTISTVGITVANTGNIAEYFSMKVANSSPDTWTPVSGTPATDQFKLMAYMNATEPADATFVDALTTSIPGAGATLYGQASTRTAPLSTKNLWLRLTMPAGVSLGTANAQTMIVSINGQSS
jgi:hypothetical protein